MIPASPALPLSARYALSAATCLARLAPGERLSAAELSARTHVPAAFLAKLLQQLGRAGIVAGEKGRRGGYALAQPAQTVTLEAVISALSEAPSAPFAPACAMGDRACDPTNPCPLHDLWLVATRPIRTLLATTTLADVARSAEALAWAGPAAGDPH